MKKTLCNSYYWIIRCLSLGRDDICPCFALCVWATFVYLLYEVYRNVNTTKVHTPALWPPDPTSKEHVTQSPLILGMGVGISLEI